MYTTEAKGVLQFRTLQKTISNKVVFLLRNETSFVELGCTLLSLYCETMSIRNIIVKCIKREFGLLCGELFFS